MRVRPGTIINPPPRPRKEPITPARIAIKKLEILMSSSLCLSHWESFSELR